MTELRASYRETYCPKDRDYSGDEAARCAYGAGAELPLPAQRALATVFGGDAVEAAAGCRYCFGDSEHPSISLRVRRALPNPVLRFDGLKLMRRGGVARR